MFLYQDSGNDKLINRTLELLSEWNAGLTTSKGHGIVKETCAELQRDGKKIMPYLVDIQFVKLLHAVLCQQKLCNGNKQSVPDSV